MKLKLPFGLKEDRIVQIHEVESGLGCGCNCPACNHPLVAKKGKINIHHFAHHKQAECQSAFETSLHLAAKKVIEEAGYIMLPEVKNEIFVSRRADLAPKTRLNFDSIYLERKYDDFIPDIIIETKGRFLNIEIRVSHAVYERKRRKIENSELSTIEVDLSKINRLIDFELLRECIVDSADNTTWLFNAKRNRLHKHIISQSLKRKKIPRGLMVHVDGCPLPARVWEGKPYANYIDDCCACEFYVEAQQKNDDDFIYCIGHKTDNEVNELIVFQNTPKDALHL